MTNSGDWGFYGRQQELAQLRSVLARGRWFFLKLTGRRRIGKTTLVQHALRGDVPVFYVQVPDSERAGVLSAVADALETFRLLEKYPRPTSMGDFAATIDKMARDGFIVVLDEFQYFNRKHLSEFTSMLQARVDDLTRAAARVPGGLAVLGSIHTEMAALLEERHAPLYSRTTDEIVLSHLDIGSVVSIIKEHAEYNAERLLFLWNLFEGVPKFYRDSFEQGVLGASRREVLRRLFFQSSSPLRHEAENWFLKELRGRYDVVLKYIARKPGADHADLTAHIRSAERGEQVAGYLKVLIDRYGMIERRLPVFAKPRGRRGRYYITDNFLRTWLAALANPVAAMNFRPLDQLIDDADTRLENAEGHGLEKLAGQLYEERSRKGVGDFELTQRIQGYWNSPDTEIDLVAVNESGQQIRFASCKRSASDLVAGSKALDGHIERFLGAFPRYRDWQITKAGIAPTIPAEIRRSLEGHGHIPQSLDDLLEGIAP